VSHVKYGPHLKRAKRLAEFNRYGNLSKPAEFQTSTYVLHLLLVIWSQFQRKVLESGIRSYKKRSKYISIDITV